MNSFNRRVYQMLNRILVFATTYPQFFAKDALPWQLLETIRAAIEALSGHASSQVSGMGAVRASSITRSEARSALRSQVDAISRTARSLKLAEFWLPRYRGDVSYLEVGKVFLKNAQPFKQLFIDGHLPADFLEKLDIAIRDLERAIAEQTACNAARTSATRAIEHTRTEAVSALQRLDPIMENRLRDDPATLAVWQSCRRVERVGASKSDEREGPPQTDPHIRTASTAAG